MAALICPSSDAVQKASQLHNTPGDPHSLLPVPIPSQTALKPETGMIMPLKRSAPGPADTDTQGRAGPSSPGVNKRHRAGPSRLDQITWLEETEGEQYSAAQPHLRSTQVQPPQTNPQFQSQLHHSQSTAQAQLSQPHGEHYSSAQLTQGQHQLRRITPQAIPPIVGANASGNAATAGVNKSKPARRVVPEAMPSRVPHHGAVKRDATASSIQSSLQLNRVNSALSGEQGHHRQEASSFSAAADYSQSDLSVVSAASSDGVSQDDEEAQQDDEEGNSEDVSGKVLTEFGCRGDLWWDDFIAAKEEMLTEVLQVFM